MSLYVISFASSLGITNKYPDWPAHAPINCHVRIFDLREGTGRMKTKTVFFVTPFLTTASETVWIVLPLGADPLLTRTHIPILKPQMSVPTSFLFFKNSFPSQPLENNFAPAMAADELQVHSSQLSTL